MKIAIAKPDGTLEVLPQDVYICSLSADFPGSPVAAIWVPKTDDPHHPAFRHDHGYAHTQFGLLASQLCHGGQVFYELTGYTYQQFEDFVKNRTYLQL